MRGCAIAAEKDPVQNVGADLPPSRKRTTVALAKVVRSAR
jgi:hypothetical protein